MEDETVPEPDESGGVPVDTGSQGSQAVEPDKESSALTRIPGPDDDNVGAVLGEHISARSPITMAIAVAAFRDAQASRQILKDQLNRTNDDRDDIRERWHEEAKTSAVLSTKLKLSTGFSRLQRWTVAVGAVLAGAGLGSGVQVGTARFVDGLLLAAGLVVIWIGSSKTGEE